MLASCCSKAARSSRWHKTLNDHEKSSVGTLLLGVAVLEAAPLIARLAQEVQHLTNNAASEQQHADDKNETGDNRDGFTQ